MYLCIFLIYCISLSYAYYIYIGYGGFIELKHTCAGKATMWKDDGTPFREVEDNLWSLNRRIQDCNAIDVDVHVRIYSGKL